MIRNSTVVDPVWNTEIHDGLMENGCDPLVAIAYLTTLSARITISFGIERPSAFAVLRLMTSL